MTNPPFDENLMKAQFDFHRSHPDVPFESHVRSKRIELGRSIDSMEAIYLDTCYWIFFRDVTLNVTKSETLKELLKTLRKLVNAGKVFCPISDTTLIELLKQGDIKKREAIIKLVDELSLGITFCQEEERTGTELAHFLYKSMGLSSEIYPLKWLIWSKIAYSLGVLQVSVPWLDDKENLVTQKAFFDYLWTVSFSDIIKTVGLNKSFPKLPLDELAMKLNTLNRQYSDELNSYKTTYLREFLGSLDLVISKADEIADEIHIAIYGKKRAPNKSGNLVDSLKALFYEAARKGNISKILPTLHINAHCHALIRWDKSRKLEGNDIPDFQHARTAIPYCIAFFTEERLSVLLLSKNVALDKEYSCKIISDSSVALDFLSTL